MRHDGIGIPLAGSCALPRVSARRRSTKDSIDGNVNRVPMDVRFVPYAKDFVRDESVPGDAW